MLDDRASPLGVLFRLLHRGADAAMIAVGHQAPRAMEIIIDRAERLIDFMDQGGDHVAKLIQPRRVDQLGLQIL